MYCDVNVIQKFLFNIPLCKLMQFNAKNKTKNHTNQSNAARFYLCVYVCVCV